jgi:hypothetical protein
MAVSHRSSIGAAATTNTTSLTVVIPAGVLANDILILVTANFGATTDPTVVDDDTGGNTWAKLSGEDNTGSGDVWWKRATSGTASKTITVSNCTTSCSAVLSAFSGCLLSGNPYEAESAEANASGNETHASITTLGAGRYVCLAVANLANDNATSAQDATDPNTLQELIEHLNDPTGASNDCATVLAAAPQAIPGATGAVTWAQTNGITVSVVFALIPEPVTPSLTFIEPGTDATGGLERYTSSEGSVSSATDAPVAMTGPRSLKCSTGAGSAAARVQGASALNDTGRRGYFDFEFDVIPTATVSVSQGLTAASASVWHIRLDAAGAMSFGAQSGTFVTGAILAVNTKYRVSWAVRIISTAVYAINVWINGVFQGTANAGTAATTASLNFLIGPGAAAGANRTCWFDNIYVDDGGDLTDPCAGFGAILVTAKKPAANNTNNFDTNIGNNPANRWENVNEVPLSVTNGWSQGILADTQENYTLQTAAQGDVDITGMTIVGREAWLWGKGTLGGLGTPQIMDNGTETAIVLTASGKLFTVLTTTSAYPSNAAGIGMRATNNADDTFLYECGTVIAVLQAASSATYPGADGCGAW